MIYGILYRKCSHLQSTQLSRSILISNQVEAGLFSSSVTKSDFQILHTRISGPISKISGLGFFTVCMEFFASVSDNFEQYNRRLAKCKQK
jgi:hypothetical protein